MIEEMQDHAQLAQYGLKDGEQIFLENQSQKQQEEKVQFLYNALVCNGDGAKAELCDKPKVLAEAGLDVGDDLESHKSRHSRQ